MSDTTANTGTEQDPDVKKDETGQQKKKAENNGQNNGDNLETLWDDPVVEGDKDKLSGQVEQQKQQQTDPNAAFTAHIESLKLSDGLNLDEISAELNQGNTTALNKAFSHMASNIYRQSMIDASKIIDKKVQEGVDKAIKSSTNAVQGNMAVDKMQATLAFTAKPVISPIANAVLAQLIKKGKSVDDAIAGVKVFFKQTAQLSGKELGLNPPPNARPGQRPFNSNVIDDSEETEEVDWLETLNV